ncbi:MAG: DnaJ domain-containing protein [Chitinophagales bacterium]
MRKDYYYILGVKKNATIHEIKEAFRKLSLKFHPDMNKENDSNFWSDRFIELKEAYDILSDENKRKEYDKNIEAEKEETNLKSDKNNSYNEILFLNDLDKDIEAYLQKKKIAKQYVDELSNIYPSKKKMTTEKWTVSILLLLIFTFLASKSSLNLNFLDFQDNSHEILANNEKVSIYVKPDINSEKIGLLQADESGVEFIAQTKYFYKIKYSTDSFGYVRKSKISYTNTELPFDEITKQEKNITDKFQTDTNDLKQEEYEDEINVSVIRDSI